MTSIRGLSINTTPISILEGSYQVTRNLISEEDTIALPGESQLYGGLYNVNGTFSTAYRPQTCSIVVC